MIKPHGEINCYSENPSKCNFTLYDHFMSFNSRSRFAFQLTDYI